MKNMEVLKYIYNYKSFIEQFENRIISECNIKDKNNVYDFVGLSFPGSGHIGDYEYHFHGAGCRVLKKNVICEYDFLKYSKILKYQFSVWKLNEFIKSFYGIDIEDIKLREQLELLVKLNKLSKLQIDDKVFNIYLI